MFINEVCKLTGLTKKAISYYEKQKLIRPMKGDNGYREYTQEDVLLLKEISIYRKLDIPIKDIKEIIKSEDKKSTLSNIIEKKQKQEIQIKFQRMYLERIIDNEFTENYINKLNEEIIENERNSGDFIRKELIRAFPSGIGKYLAYHFAPYLNEPLDMAEKYKALSEIIEFLDNVPEIKIPKFIELGYENMTDDMYKSINEGMKNEINNMLNAEGQELEVYKKKILDSIDRRNHKSLRKFMNPYNKFKKQLNEFFISSGYYDIFIPNMKILSSDYREYQDKLVELNELMSKEMGIKYDENMNIIKINN